MQNDLELLTEFDLALSVFVCITKALQPARPASEARASDSGRYWWVKVLQLYKYVAERDKKVDEAVPKELCWLMSVLLLMPLSPNPNIVTLVLVNDCWTL